MLNALLSETDWMHACGGKGRCTSCRATVLEGHDVLSGLTGAEKRFADAGRLSENERLTCQAVLEAGDVVISVPAACQLPHINYTT